MNNRAGRYKTNLSGVMAYRSFVPNPLPPAPPVELTEDIVALLVKANSQLAVLRVQLPAFQMPDCSYPCMCAKRP